MQKINQKFILLKQPTQVSPKFISFIKMKALFTVIDVSKTAALVK